MKSKLLGERSCILKSIQGHLGFIVLTKFSWRNNSTTHFAETNITNFDDTYF